MEAQSWWCLPSVGKHCGTLGALPGNWLRTHKAIESTAPVDPESHLPFDVTLSVVLVVGVLHILSLLDLSATTEMHHAGGQSDWRPSLCIADLQIGSSSYIRLSA